MEHANRTSCPTFPNVPAEHVSEVTRLRVEIMRALTAAPEGSPEAERLGKLLTYFDRILFCPRPGGPTTRRGGAKHRRTEPDSEHESG